MPVVQTQTSIKLLDYTKTDSDQIDFSGQNSANQRDLVSCSTRRMTCTSDSKGIHHARTTTKRRCIDTNEGFEQTIANKIKNEKKTSDSVEDESVCSGEEFFSFPRDVQNLSERREEDHALNLPKGGKTRKREVKFL